MASNILIDSRLLITLVEARPAIWDKSLDIFKNRNETKKAWAEIFVEFRSDFEELGEDERTKLGKGIMKRWENIRWAYAKSFKRERFLTRSGAAVSSMKKYLYREELQFLNKVLDEHEMPNSREEMPQDGSDVESSEHGSNEGDAKTPGKMLSIDIEGLQLISSIEARPVLWDKTLGAYKDRDAKKKAWTEICVELNSDFEELREKDKNHYYKDVVRKWSHIRDSYVKSLKKQKWDAGVKKYVYHNHLQFLNNFLAEHLMPSGQSVDDENPRDGSDDETSDEYGSNERVAENSRMVRRPRSDFTSEIDNQQLLSLVEARPVLWNRTLEVYRVKSETRKAWTEICLEVYKDFEGLGENDKNYYCKALIRIWTNIRDAYVKSLKRQKFAPDVKKYVYHNHLQFLNNFLDEPQDGSDHETSDHGSNEVVAKNPSIARRSRSEIISLINNRQLISLVEARPVLWDRTRAIYKDKNETKKAWMEICLEVFKDFEGLDEYDKHHHYKELMPMWTNLRSRYFQSLKKQKLASGTKKYVYHNRLQFLNKLLDEQHQMPTSLSVDEENVQDGSDDETSEHESNECVTYNPRIVLRSRSDITSEIDNLQLISLIEARPVLWDRTLVIFNDKNKTKKAWMEICLIVFKDFEGFGGNEKNHHCREVMQIWRNIRDAYVKSLKKQQLAPDVKKYVYHYHLQFLNKLLDEHQIPSSLSVDDEDLQDGTDDETSEHGSNERVTKNPGVVLRTRRDITSKIDNLQLISLVEAKPVLWDRKLEVYEDKNETKKAWMEICLDVFKDFEGFGENEKHHHSREIKLLWKHIRDRYVLTLKEQKWASGAKSAKKYAYHNHLQFLNEHLDEHQMPSTLSVDEENLQDGSDDETSEHGSEGVAKNPRIVLRSRSDITSEIDNRKLISLVKAKPILWDRTLIMYYERKLTKKAWMEICLEVFKDFEGLRENEKNNHCREVIRIWTNIRDSYVKSLKKQQLTPDVKKYVYHYHLQFLNKLLDEHQIPSSVSVDEEILQDGTDDETSEHGSNEGVTKNPRMVLRSPSDVTSRIDNRQFICLVEAKAVLWDRTLIIYNDKKKTKKAWMEICLEVFKDFEKLGENDKNHHCRELMRLWKNIRDAYVKCLKKQKWDADVKNYIYHNHLQFLNKLLDEHQMPDSLLADEENPQDESDVETSELRSNEDGTKERPRKPRCDTNIDIDVDQLISLVEVRPVLWDNTLVVYTDRNATKKAWTEICKELKSDFEELEEQERMLFGKEVMKRWQNIRGAQVKSLKKQNYLARVGAPSIKKYMYHEQLQFLNKVVVEHQIPYSLSGNEGNPQDVSDVETCEHGSNEGVIEKAMKLQGSRSDVNIDFDSEVLILCIEARPVLWNKSLITYKDRNATKKAWAEIFVEINHDFKEMGHNEKKIFGKEVIKKWANIRDAYVKYRKKEALIRRSGVGISNIKKYVYHNQLQFLNAVIDEQQMPDSLSREGSDVETYGQTSEHGNSEGVSVTPGMALRPRKRKLPQEESDAESSEHGSTEAVPRKPQKTRVSQKRKLDEVELRILELLEEHPSDRHMSFFKGVVPSLQDFDEDEIVQLQLGVLQLISNIKQQKRLMETTFYAANQ